MCLIWPLHDVEGKWCQEPLFDSWSFAEGLNPFTSHVSPFTEVSSHDVGTCDAHHVEAAGAAFLARLVRNTRCGPCSAISHTPLAISSSDALPDDAI